MRFVGVFLMFLCANFCQAVVVDDLVKKYQNRQPRHRGLDIEGVVKSIGADAVFLTFDFCENGFDVELINFLIKHQVPATLFVTKTWIENNRKIAQDLAGNAIFSIQNHGWQHRPCFVRPGNVYKILASGSVRGVVDEILGGQGAIFEITSKKPTFYRSGTAYYDDVCIDIALEMGYKIAGFSVLGDAGGTYSSSEVYRRILSANPGDIVILHGTKPRSGTREGVKRAVLEMRQKGVVFAKM